jgi:hypothetical protein
MMMKFVVNNILNIVNTINNLRELGLQGIIATLTLKRVLELTIMTTLFVIPIPGTLEAYLVGKTAYKKYRANKLRVEVA